MIYLITEKVFDYFFLDEPMGELLRLDRERSYWQVKEDRESGLLPCLQFHTASILHICLPYYPLPTKFAESVKNQGGLKSYSSTLTNPLNCQCAHKQVNEVESLLSYNWSFSHHWVQIPHSVWDKQHSSGIAHSCRDNKCAKGERETQTKT